MYANSEEAEHLWQHLTEGQRHDPDGRRMHPTDDNLWMNIERFTNDRTCSEQLSRQIVDDWATGNQREVL